MNATLLRLELRKNWLAAASVAAAFFITLPVSRLVAAASGLQTFKALEAILYAWVLIGLPFAALLIGGAAGAQAAARDVHDAESVLPVSPRRRTAASLAAGVLLLAAVAALLLSVTRLCGSDMAVRLTSNTPEGEFTWGTGGWDLLPFAPLATVALLEALLASWVLAYLIGHGVAGGILSLLLIALTLAGMVSGFGLDMFYATRYWGPGFEGFVRPALLLSLAAKLLAAERAAAWRERRPRLGARGVALLAGALLAGPIMFWGATNWILRGLRAQMMLSEPSAFTAHSAEFERMPLTARYLEASGREAAFKTVQGGVIMAGSAGARVVVPENPSGLTDFLFQPYQIGAVWDVLRGSDGRVWTTRRDLFESQLWREKADGAAEVRKVPDGFSFNPRWMARRLVVAHWISSDNKELYADADDFFRRGGKAAWTDFKRLLAQAESAPDAAKVACGGRCLTRGATTWRLPGRAFARGSVLPIVAGGRPAYLIPVTVASGAVVVLCRLDGRVETAWRMRRTFEGGFGTDFYALPDGTLYARGPEKTLGFVDVSGRAAHATSLARLRKEYPETDKDKDWSELVRRDASGNLLVVRADRLFALDRNGLILSARPLPRGVRAVHPLRDGFLADTPGGLYFSDWDGNTRRIRKP